MGNAGNKNSTEILIRNHIIPAIFIGITVSFTIFALSLFHVYIVPVAKFIVFSSFASTSFLLFMESKQSASRISKFVKSYIIAGIMGIAGFFISVHIGIYYSLAVVETAIALLLVITESEHPPAMGIGVVFIFERANIFALAFLLTGMVIIILMDKFLNKFIYVLKNDVKVEIKKL